MVEIAHRIRTLGFSLAADKDAAELSASRVPSEVLSTETAEAPLRDLVEGSECPRSAALGPTDRQH